MLPLSAGRRESVIKAVSGVIKLVEEARTGLAVLAKQIAGPESVARNAVGRDPAVLSGTPCIKGTRIPAHDIAEMLANGDSVGAVHDAFPRITVEQIELAAFYARAYPRRGRPRRTPFWRSRTPSESSEIPLDELLPAR